MARYEFLTTWCLAAPIQRVWDTLYDSEHWPEWWRGVERVEVIEPGEGEDRIGELARYTWRSRLPYRLEFDMRTTNVKRPFLAEGRAQGALAGDGRWRLFEGNGATAVTYEWSVETTERWMNALSPVARPVFAWNHDWVMSRGGEGLARRLGVPLLASG
jgi:uncharacterized protein YndB with AHSA1/START domain